MSDVDHKVLLMYEKLEQAGLLRPVTELTPDEDRTQELKALLLFMSPESEKKIERIENLMIPRIHERGEIPIRIYHPKKDQTDVKTSEKTAIIVFIHGGDFLAGELLSVHETCCMLTSFSGAITVSVDYRLAPEYKFPLGLNDCYDAAIWTAQNASRLGADPSKLVVAGDSAGGNLAAALCLMARDHSELHLAMQGLIYPVTDLSRDMAKYSGAKYGPSKEEMDWFTNHYLTTPKDALNPFASPYLADLQNLPTAVIITAGHDPLREQDLDYSRKLEQSGVKVNLYDYPAMVHGFFTLPGYFPSGREAIEELAKHIRQL